MQLVQVELGSERAMGFWPQPRDLGTISWANEVLVGQMECYSSTVMYAVFSDGRM